MLAAGFIVTVLLAYLLGSIPIGYLLGKARGIDIRATGSGNIGATNVVRTLGKGAGALVLLLDAAKGWVAVAAAATLIAPRLGLHSGEPTWQWLRVCAGLAAVLGHNYTCWLRFKGGKGIATSAGVLLALAPAALAIGLAVWVVVFVLTRYVSLASICAAVTLPVASWLTSQGPVLVVVTAAMSVLAVYRHRANIQRLRSGTETRLSLRKRTASGE